MDVWPDRGRRAASLPTGGGSLGVYGRGELGVGTREAGRAGGRALPGRLGVSVGFRGRSANAVSAMEEEARVGMYQRRRMMLLLLMSRKQKSGMYKKCKVGGGGCARGGGISLLLTTTRDLNHRSASAGTDQPACSNSTAACLLSLSRRTPCHTTHHSAPLLSSIFNLPQPHEQHAEPLNASPSDLRRER